MNGATKAVPSAGDSLFGEGEEKAGEDDADEDDASLADEAT